MRKLILWSFILAVTPHSVVGQASPWNNAINAAARAFGQQQYREAELQFMEAKKEAESFGPADDR